MPMHPASPPSTAEKSSSGDEKDEGHLLRALAREDLLAVRQGPPPADGQVQVEPRLLLDGRRLHGGNTHGGVGQGRVHCVNL